MYSRWTVAMHVLRCVIPYLINSNRKHSTIARVCRFMMNKSIGYGTDKTSSGGSRAGNSGTQLRTNSSRSSNNNNINFLVSLNNNAFNFSSSSNTVGISSPGSNGYFDEEKSIFNDNSLFAAFSDLGNMDDLSFFD